MYIFYAGCMLIAVFITEIVILHKYVLYYHYYYYYTDVCKYLTTLYNQSKNEHVT